MRGIRWAGLFLALALGFLLAASAAVAELRGHGGPVRALAVTADGARLISGSFDGTAILWALGEDRALAVLRAHEGAVNAVLALPDGHIATGGEDGRILLWRPGQGDPERALTGHQGPVAGLAVSPDGRHLASVSWDRTVRVWPLAGGEPRVLSGHTGNVNAVAFLGPTLVSAGYDGSLRIWEEGRPDATLIGFPTPLNALAATGEGLAVGGADGIVRILAASGRVLRETEPLGSPVIALAASPDATLIAAAGIRGAVTLIDGATARVRATLIGPGLPVWSLAFHPDGKRLVTGGGDHRVRIWDVATGEPIGASALTPPGVAGDAGDRGAQMFRACAACHTLTADAQNRAGPTLHQIFGRRIATAPGYPYSAALRGMDIVWTPETLRRLFEIGPAAYTPGTKMPEQTIANRDDLDALVRFLEAATR